MGSVPLEVNLDKGSHDAIVPSPTLGCFFPAGAEVLPGVARQRCPTAGSAVVRPQLNGEGGVSSADPQLVAKGGKSFHHPQVPRLVGVLDQIKHVDRSQLAESSVVECKRALIGYVWQFKLSDQTASLNAAEDQPCGGFDGGASPAGTSLPAETRLGCPTERSLVALEESCYVRDGDAPGLGIGAFKSDADHLAHSEGSLRLAHDTDLAIGTG